MSVIGKIDNTNKTLGFFKKNSDILILTGTILVIIFIVTREVPIKTDSLEKQHNISKNNTLLNTASIDGSGSTTDKCVKPSDSSTIEKNITDLENYIKSSDFSNISTTPKGSILSINVKRLRTTFDNMSVCNSSFCNNPSVFPGSVWDTDKCKCDSVKDYYYDSPNKACSNIFPTVYNTNKTLLDSYYDKDGKINFPLLSTTELTPTS